jgi:hypothetical protein
MARDNFKVGTKRTLAERAGYICSFPGCNQLTIGPSKIFKKAILTGKASHIEAASPNGPRYNKNQKKDERISIENGIWLCPLHADLIDKDDTRYSALDIKEWKKQHEENIYYKQCGISPEGGNVIKISIFNYGPITNSLDIELHKNSIIWGRNGIGKTLICENLSGLIYKEKITKRWAHGEKEFSSTFDITFLKERKQEIKIEITESNNINYYYNNIIFPNIISPYNVVYVEDVVTFDYFKLDKVLSEIEEDDERTVICNKFYLNVILKHLNINIDVFKTLIKYITLNEKYFIFGIEFNDDILGVQIRQDSHLSTYDQLSGSERQRIILEFAFQLSKLYSEISPTLFILEQGAISIFDDEFVVRLLKLLIDKNFNFQTIITFADLYLSENFPHAYDSYHLNHLIFEDDIVKLDTK